MTVPDRGLVERQVRAYYAAVDADEVDTLLDLFTDDCVYRRPGYEPIRGRDAMERFYRGERVIESGSHTLSELMVDGAHAAVHGRFEGVLRDGTHKQVGFADFYRFTGDGRAAERTTYFHVPSV